jgi:hypothetical protein
MEVVSRRDDEEWQRHFEEEQRWQNLQEQANVGTFLSVMALAKAVRGCVFAEGFEAWDHFEVDGGGLCFECERAFVILIAPHFYACLFLEIDAKGILLDGANLIEFEEKQGLFGGDIEADPCFSCIGATRGIVWLVGGCAWCVAAATFAEVDANPKDAA